MGFDLDMLGAQVFHEYVGEATVRDPGPSASKLSSASQRASSAAGKLAKINPKAAAKLKALSATATAKGDKIKKAGAAAKAKAMQAAQQETAAKPPATAKPASTTALKSLPPIGPSITAPVLSAISSGTSVPRLMNAVVDMPIMQPTMTALAPATILNIQPTAPAPAPAPTYTAPKISTTPYVAPTTTPKLTTTTVKPLTTTTLRTLSTRIGALTAQMIPTDMLLAAINAYNMMIDVYDGFANQVDDAGVAGEVITLVTPLLQPLTDKHQTGLVNTGNNLLMRAQAIIDDVPAAGPDDSGLTMVGDITQTGNDLMAEAEDWIQQAREALAASGAGPGATTPPPSAAAGAKVVVTPISVSIAQGLGQQFQAQLLDANKKPVAPINPVQWSVTPATGATIDASGNFQAQSGGAFTVTAVVDGVTGSGVANVQGSLPGGGGPSGGGGGGGGGGGDAAPDEGGDDEESGLAEYGADEEGGDEGDQGGEEDLTEGGLVDPEYINADDQGGGDDSEVGHGGHGGGGHGHGGHGHGRGWGGGWGWGGPWWDGPYDGYEILDVVEPADYHFDAEDVANAVVAKMKDKQKGTIVGAYDIQQSQRQMNTLKAITVSIARALVKHGLQVADETIKQAEGGFFTKALPNLQTLKNARAHVQWHADKLAGMPDPTAMYADGEDLKKWVMEAFINANAVEEGRSRQEEIWTEMWTEIGDALAKLPAKIVKMVAALPGQILEAVTGIPVWAFYVGGSVIVCLLGFGAYRLLRSPATHRIAENVITKRLGG